MEQGTKNWLQVKEADNLGMFTDSAERFYFILLSENRFPAKKIS